MANIGETFFILIFCGSVAGIPFTDEELKLFTSMDLCEHFGGKCGENCPFRYLTHKWGIPLCPESSVLKMQCCTGPPLAAPKGVEETTNWLLETTSTTTTAVPVSTAAKEYDSCGKLEMPHVRRKKRIVGGMVASLESWPWLVGFRSLLGSHVCSGAIIAQRWVITAAHCFKHISNPSLWRVRIGDHNLLAQEPGERDINVQSIIMHPGYSARQHISGINQTLQARYERDIALVRLSEDTLTEPICLPSATDDSFVTELSDSTSESESRDNGVKDGSNDIKIHTGHMGEGGFIGRFNEIPTMGFEDPQETRGSEEEAPDANTRDSSCWVAGWGATLDTSADQLLHEVPGDVIDSRKCSAMWGERLQDDMVCFGDGTYGPCLGDSGGPLACERDGVYYLVGIVAWGTEECNIVGYPSVFTNIQPYLTWIYEQLNNHL